MKDITRFARVSVLWMAAVLLIVAPAAWAQADPYETYIKTSKDFQSVKQDADWLYTAFPSWTYMPWRTGTWQRAQKTLPKDWWVRHGYNGAVFNRGDAYYLDWANEYGLRFYVDHAAGKYDLMLHNGTPPQSTLKKIFYDDLRTVPVNEKLRTKLHKVMRGYISQYTSSPYRAAYALDDEISWGHFVYPAMWRITDDEEAFPRWLEEIYGPGKAPPREGWTTYESIWPSLKEWSIGQFDCSELMDQWTFNDSYWNNFIGDLVEYSNRLDARTPCGFVGGQSPNAFGGFDYAKVMRKVQFIESYNLGGSQAVIRSLNPNLAVPAVMTHFHKSVDDSAWQMYYYLGHGVRGFIGWVDQHWFTGPSKPTDIHAKLAPHYKLVNEKLGPLVARSQWVHDGVAILYNQASIQMSWIMDAEAHGTTWKNRRNDFALGTSHNVRHAWENMLRDEGLQYNFYSYVDVIRDGIPAEYKVLILPATFCLSDAEARKIKEFCRAGGTVIADFLPGLWDQHGKPRPEGGALDDMFGVKQDTTLKAGDVFQEKFWAEVDQDRNYSTWKKSRREFLTNRNTCITHPLGFNKAVRKGEVDHVNTYGRGKAVLMNLSPQWYNAHRQTGYKDSLKRKAFMKHVRAAGLNPWVRIRNAGEKEHGYEISYFAKGGRTIVFVTFNPEVHGTSLGGGNSVGLKTDTIPITLEFAAPVRGVRDEITGRSLGSGKSFKFTWTMNHAVVLSFDGEPPR